MNYYSLMRNFWDFAFAHPEKIKPNHCAVYCFAVEHCNRLGWKRKFGFPTEMVKDAVGIASYNTYIKTLNDLIDFKLLTLIQKSENQYSACIIALSNFDKAHDKSLDEAVMNHNTKQAVITEQITRQINDSIIRPIYQPTNLPINQSKTKNENLIYELKESEDWLNVIAMQNRIKPEEVVAWLSTFDLKLQSEQDQKFSKKDLCSHFARWLPLELKKLTKETGLNPNQQKEKIGGF